MAAIHLLTDPKIKAAKPGDKIIQMPDGGGLYLYVRPSGLKSWLFVGKLRGERVEMSLGSYPDVDRGVFPGVSLKEARAKAADLRRQMQDGINPKEAAREAEEARKKEAERKAREAERPQTVEELFRRWKASELEHIRDEEGKIIRKGRKDEGTEIERSFTKDVFPVIGQMKPSEVESDHIFSIRDRIMRRGVTRTANVCLTNLKQMFAYAALRKFVGIDPTNYIKKASFGGVEKTGDRWLTDPEITELATRLCRTVDGNRPLARPTQIAILFLLATGCRIGEVVRSEWKNVDFEKRTLHIPQEIRKSNRNYPAKDHDVYLSDLSITLLTELKRFTGHTPYLFPNRKGDAHLDDKTITKQVRDRQTERKLKGRAKGGNALELKGGSWTPHDLRRTASTLVIRLATQQQFSKESAELLSAKIRSHLNPNPLARVYEHYLYDGEMRACWTALGDHLLTLIPKFYLEPKPLGRKKQTAVWKTQEMRDAVGGTPIQREPLPIFSEPGRPLLKTPSIT